MGLIETIMEDVYNKKRFQLQGIKETFTSRVVLKKFIMDLHDKLVEKDFKDTLSPGNHKKGGELPQAKTSENFNRTGDMFESKYAIIDNGNSREFEMLWEGEREVPMSEYGIFRFKIDLTARNVKDKEILVGNKKMVVQQAKWEFRNKLLYINTVMEDHIDNIPLLSHFPKLKKAYFKLFYKDQINADIDMMLGKLKSYIYDVIYKHFRD